MSAVKQICEIMFINLIAHSFIQPRLCLTATESNNDLRGTISFVINLGVSLVVLQKLSVKNLIKVFSYDFQKHGQLLGCGVFQNELVPLLENDPPSISISRKTV